MKISQESTLNKSTELKKEFKKRPSLFRIEAVIHDGQYYDVKKWARVALVTIEEIEEYIEKHKNYLIEKLNVKTNTYSYRVSCKQILEWYSKNNLEIKKHIVPNNFTPKIWNGFTEVEMFENNPRRYVDTVLISFYKNSNDNEKIIEKLKNIVYGYGKWVTNCYGKIYVYTLNSSFLKQKIENELSARELEQTMIRIRNSFLSRDICSFPEEFLSYFIELYLPYAVGIGKMHNKTIGVFLQSDDDKYSQYVEWILEAIRKYDESIPVPFSGYLSSVLQRWPYDLPDYYLGKKLSKFQRERFSTMDSFNDKNYSEQELEIKVKERMLEKYTEQEYDELLSQHNNWKSLTSTSNIIWKENGEEKLKNTSKNTKVISSDISMANKISYSLIKAALKTKKTKDFFNIVSNFENFNIKTFNNIDNKFKENLYKELMSNEKKNN